jgi:hypothetical protein
MTGGGGASLNAIEVGLDSNSSFAPLYASESKIDPGACANGYFTNGVLIGGGVGRSLSEDIDIGCWPVLNLLLVELGLPVNPNTQ